MDETKIKDILLKEDYISQTDLAAAEKYATDYNTSALDYLLDQGIVSKQLLGQAVAESFGVPFMNLDIHVPAKEDVIKLSEESAKKFQAVLAKEEKNNLIIATADPANPDLPIELKLLFPGKSISVVYSPLGDIEKSYFNYRKLLATRFGEIIKAGGKVAPEIIDQILQDAITLHASDIHFEPQGTEVLIRFRVDGVLAEAGRLEKQYYENIVNRIKVQAKLRIDEHQSTQDGAVRFSQNGLMADLRISIVPTLEGEKIAIRLLSSYVQEIEFSDLGLAETDEVSLLESAKKPFGMILVTGPTGSGKTTTLYALVKNLASPEINITTIEDPVEYKILGINQIQVNPQTNLTFGKGLRSIARQDPDIILVGEIRDLETAEIAVNAALTGHLLLSTFHANDAAAAIPRLLDMGIEPFLLASTLDVIIAQRLVRKICPNCRTGHLATPEEARRLAPLAAQFTRGKNLTLYSGKGCSVCNNTGFRGRVGVFELLKVTPKLAEVIVTNPASNKVLETARRQGFTGMWTDGVKKVVAGDTTLEELTRVVQPPKGERPAANI